MRELDVNSIIENNIENIKLYLKKKNIEINYIDEIANKITVEIGEPKEFPYAKIDKKDSFKIIISGDISEENIYKWLNHEIIHVISNNLKTTNEINVGGVIIEDKQKNIWIGQYLNEAITEYINQEIIHSKYNDYYDKYLEALDYIIDIIEEDIVLKAYFSNNLLMIIHKLAEITGKNEKSIIEFIDSIDHLYDKNEYLIKI